MIEISAKENATVDVIQSDFPLGKRDKLLLHIGDPVIKDLISLKNTGTCNENDNYYKYGQFNSTNNLILDIQPQTSVTISPGKGINYSNCLYCKSIEGYNKIIFPLSNNIKLIKDKEYVLTCYINVIKGKVNLTTEDNIFNIEQQILNDNDDDWVQIRQEFTALSEDFNLWAIFENDCEFYIDFLLFFEKDKEIKLPENNIAAEIDIISPFNPKNNKIYKVINWNKDEDKNEVQVLFYFPEITVVDFQDNILCDLKIFQHLPEKVSTLGNVVYHEVNTVIFESEPFVLNGYIIPLDVGIDVDLVTAQI